MTVTGPMFNSRTGSAMTDASPTSTTTSRSSGKALTTAAVASTVPVVGQPGVQLGLVVVRELLLDLIGQRAATAAAVS